MKKYSSLILILTIIFSCKKEVKIDFTEQSIETSEIAEIAINFPKAIGSEDVANQINKVISNYIVNQMNLTEDNAEMSSIDDAVAKFNYEFRSFKIDFPDATHKWEAFIDGEVTYYSPEIISIALNSYFDTGGAHGNTNVRFFNFNPQTGTQFNTKDLIGNIEGLSEVVEQKLKEKIKGNTSNESMEDEFFGKDFQLPESFGYSDEGLIILYNPYEIASYAQGIIEFTIPFEEISSFLNKN
nr:DUF3298 and DUF4163 domain-containing protein [uncultured Psychroserpens sp.]